MDLSEMQQQMCNAIKKNDYLLTKLYYSEITRHFPEDAQNECFIVGLQHAVQFAQADILGWFLQFTDRLHSTFALFRTNSEGKLPVQVAQEKGLKLIEIKLIRDPSRYIYTTNKYGKSALIDAIERNSLEAVIYLMQLGPVAQIDGSVYILAIERNNLAILELLTRQAPATCDKEAVQEYKNSALLAAIDLKRPLDIIHHLLSKDANVNARDATLGPVLHLAVQRNYLEAVKLLVSKGADIFATDSNGNTALVIAKQLQLSKIVDYLTSFLRTVVNVDDFHSVIKCGHLDSLRSLVETKSKRDVVQDGACLTLAIQHGHLDIVKYLVSLGADVCKLDADNETPLMKAISGGDADIIKFLLQNGAALTVNTALFTAIRQDRIDFVKLLIEFGADVNRVGKNGLAPLTEAIQCKSLAIVKYFTEIGANTEREGQKALDMSLKYEFYEATRFLIDSSKVDVLDNILLEDGCTLLTHFISRNDAAMVQFFLDKGVDIAKEDSNGYAPLHFALEKSTEELVKLLLQHGVDVKKLNLELFPECFEKNSLDIMKELIRNGLNVNVKIKGNTLLHEAVIDNDVYTIDFLLENGADLNITDRDNNSLLHKCLQLENIELFKTFVDRGANICAKGRTGISLLALAAHKRLFLFVDYLISQGACLVEAGADLEAFARDNEDFSYYLERVKNDKGPVRKILLEKGDGHEEAET